MEKWWKRDAMKFNVIRCQKVVEMEKTGNYNILY